MEEFEAITLAVDARGVAVVTLSRPEHQNTLSGQAIAELTQVAGLLAVDASVRVVVLTGAGESFCGGGDIGWMRAQVAGDAVSRTKAATGLAMMLNALNTLPKPLIGRVNGPAYGGGVGLLSVCDAAIGVQGAMFGLTETRLGLIPATISPYVLARIGEVAARRYLMASRVFDAEAARAIGLLAEVVAPEALDAAVEAEVLHYLGCAPGAVAEAKALIRRLAPVIDEALIADTIGRLVRRWDTAEAAEGIAALFEKRKPDWAD